MTEEFVARFNIDETLIRIIEDIVEEYDMNYIDAVIHYCETEDMDLETVAMTIAENSHLKARIQMDAEDLHYIKRTARLPI